MTDRLTITRGDMIALHDAASILAQRILPEGKAVGQFARLIRWAKPFVEETKAMGDNLTKTYAADIAAAATPAKANELAGARSFALIALTREIQPEDADHLDLPMPPQITEAMLPQVRKTDETGANTAGLAGLIAALGPAYVLADE
jgi:hypothetical protein